MAKELDLDELREKKLEQHVHTSVYVTHSGANVTTVKVEMVHGDISVQWAVKCFESTIADGTRRAREGALAALRTARTTLEEAKR